MRLCQFAGGECVACRAAMVNERQVCLSQVSPVLRAVSPYVATDAAPPAEPLPPNGPGTQLKALLAKIGITASPGCQCNSRAAHMDRMESEQPGWCEANIDEIVGWLREEATKRGLPFIDAAGRLLVRRAIRNARRTGITARR